MENIEDLSYDELIKKSEEFKHLARTKIKHERSEKIKEINALVKKYDIKRGEINFSDGARRKEGGLGFRLEPGLYKNPADGKISEVRISGRKPNWMYGKSLQELMSYRVEATK